MKNLFFTICLSSAALVSAGELTVTSYEPGETALLITSGEIQTIEKVLGGTSGAPFATDGRYVLKLSWTGQSDRKVEISQSGLSYDLGAFEKMLVDVFIPDGSALFESNGLIGIWTSNWLPGCWTGGNIVPTQIGKWFTIEMDVSSFQAGPLDSISALVFENYGSDNGTLYVDHLRLINRIPSVTATGHDSRIDLCWDPVAGAQGYTVYRAESAAGPFVKQTDSVYDVTAYSDFLGINGQTKYYYVTSLIDGYESSGSEVVSTGSFAMSDEQLLQSVEQAVFRYFWDYGHPVGGLSRDFYTPGQNTNVCAVGGTGMGLMAICVGAERGFVGREKAADRVLKILHFLQDTMPRYHGAWAHFADGETGQTLPIISPYDDGADLVETAYVAQGLLTVRQYFDADDPVEAEIVRIATTLWEEIDWEWFLRHSEAGYEDNEILYWHWSPNYGWIMNAPITSFYNEVMITYLLAIASPTHPIPQSSYYNAWACGGYKNGGRYYNYTQWVGIFEAPMFWTHYSFLGFDPRGKWDNYCNYFENSRHIALIDRSYCIANPKGFADYSGLVWGLTASVNPWGYGAHAPGEPDNGTISPTAALSSIPYTPGESTATLSYFYHHYGDAVWNPFGFVDAFNPSQSWFSAGNLAIDQGPILLMIENYRTGLCWDLFMANPEIPQMLERIGWATRVDNGLHYEYYEGTWSSLPDFDALTPAAAGRATNFDLGLRHKDDHFAFRFRGYIEVPTTGSYTFYIASDDGSRLGIDGRTVVNNDGLHGMQEHSGSIVLSAGKHSIEAVYFENDGLEELLVSYEGPDITKKQVPVNHLFLCDLAGDLNGDCRVDIDDLSRLASGWLSDYHFTDFSKMAEAWIENQSE